MARPNKYETHIKPRFKEIQKWLELGATEKEVYENLSINKDTWIKAKRNFLELTDLIKNSRKKPVTDIKAAMLKRAIGFQYEEKKVIRSKIVVKGENELEIPATEIRTEVTTKTALPDTAAGLVLLQHWAEDEGWSRDPQALKLKREELKLKKEKQDNESW